MKKFLFVAVFAFVGFLAFAQEKIAVFPFEDMEGIFTKNETIFFYRDFINEFTNRSEGKYTVVPRQEIEKLIGTEYEFQMSKFSEKAKTAETQKVLNGTQILSGLIGSYGSKLRITVSLYTYPELQQLPGGTTLTATNKDELIEKIPELVKKMQTEIDKNKPKPAPNPFVGKWRSTVTYDGRTFTCILDFRKNGTIYVERYDIGKHGFIDLYKKGSGSGTYTYNGNDVVISLTLEGVPQEFVAINTEGYFNAPNQIDADWGSMFYLSTSSGTFISGRKYTTFYKF